MKATILSFSIVCILVLASLLRLGGVSYGLPLRLIADEPQFILAAFLMAQEKTIILPTQLPDFNKLLYNPPYLAYLFLPAFFVLRYVAEVNSLTPYFVVARLFSISAGVLTVYLIYRITRQIFPKHKTAPLFAAWLLATSILAIAVSATARHWSFSTLLGVLGCAVLSIPRWPFSIRYLAAIVIAGIGMGINPILGALPIFAGAWYLLKEKGRIRELFSRWWLYAGIAIFAFLGALPWLLHPQGLRRIAIEDQGYAFTISGFLNAPFTFLFPFIQSEPVLFFLAIAGLGALWRKNRDLFWLLGGTILGYIMLFYLEYQFEHRYLAPIIPLFALLGGFAIALLWERLRMKPWWVNATVVGVILLIPFAVSVRFSSLLFRDDSRSNARAWFETHIKEGSHIFAWAALTRLAAMPEAVAETVALGAKLDTEDTNEYRFPQMNWGRRFRVLNLYNVRNQSFYEHIISYACAREFDYLLMQEADIFSPAYERGKIADLTRGATLLQSFGAAGERYSITGTKFEGSPWTLFRLREFGPLITIYRLNRETLCKSETNAVRDILEEAGIAPAGSFGAHRITLDKQYNLHMKVTSDKKATMMLFTEDNFEKARKKTDARPVALIETSSVVISRVAAGKYVLLVGSEQHDIKYRISVKVDGLIFR
ncbi:MAG: glycosyltransferase family 39 protein [Candidatus Sungiibacteriota bacterium]